MTRMFTALACALFLAACATTPVPRFDGDWSYLEHCGWRHVANLDLIQEAATVTGTWSDGENRRGRGEYGRLKGQLNGQRMEVRFCTEAPTGLKDECPAYRERFDYFVLKDGTLEWYRPFGPDGHDLYLTLQRYDPAEANTATAVCPEEFDLADEID
ncbi:MAG: hypothetical protein M3Q40_01630 [Pseudomonadota bacterium]|nr:hypothetical protein [Pseudomonadota bacterium]